MTIVGLTMLVLLFLFSLTSDVEATPVSSTLQVERANQLERSAAKLLSEVRGLREDLEAEGILSSIDDQ